MTNAVWLFMKWRNVSVEAAKAKVKDENFVTREFQALRKEFLQSRAQQNLWKLETYPAGLGYLVSGNLVWSLTCPRYHPENR
jgi:ophiobolin F synthase